MVPLLFLFLSPFILAIDAALYETQIDVVTPARTFKCIYKIAYDEDPLALNQADSRVVCNPNKKGGPTTLTEVYIPDIDRTVNVTHRIKRGADTILSMELQPPPPTEAPPPEGSMSCQCRLPLSIPDGSFASTRTLTRGGTSGLSSLKPLVASFLVSSFLGQALTRTLGVNRALLPESSFAENRAEGSGIVAPADTTDTDTATATDTETGTQRNILEGILGGNTGGLTGDSNDVMNTLVQQMVEQQVNEFINNGGAEEAINNMVSSGQLETMITSMIESGAIQDSVSQMMASGAIQQAISSSMEEAMASTGMNGGLTDFMDQLNQMSLPEFDSEDFMSNINMNDMGMEMDMNCDCIPNA